ncbi:uncharacterized protein LOC113679613, partial [Pocillopora damicornis]|uniref:uncharacterized protein LOC113679613 n=1 Tax=Pocillopora damicornis TaxID=46731 RepID=UPI000F5542C8
MFPEHITVFIFVGLSFAQEALGQNSTVVKPSPTASYTMAPMSSQAAQPTTKSPALHKALGQSSTAVVMPLPTASYTKAPMSSQAARPITKVPTHITLTQSTTEKETTTPTTDTQKPTCAMIKFVADRMWNASLGNSTSKESKA